MTRDEIFKQVQDTLTSMFEIPAEDIRLEARLYEDLDLDSIDAIDMAVKMQELTGQRVDESALRGLRTVSDVVDLIGTMTTAPRQAVS